MASITQSAAFPLRTDTVYASNNRITIHVNGEDVTRTVDEWISQDPLSFARLRDKQHFELEPHLNRVLFERIRKIPNEEKMFLGLKLNIDFPGYNDQIPASVPYKRFPVKFYNWWLENPGLIKLSFKEKLELLNNVNMLNSKALLPKHKALMNR